MLCLPLLLGTVPVPKPVEASRGSLKVSMSGAGPEALAPRGEVWRVNQQGAGAVSKTDGARKGMGFECSVLRYACWPLLDRPSV